MIPPSPQAKPPAGTGSGSKASSASSGSGAAAASSTAPSSNQPLVQWGEIANHPGLITAFQQISNNPVVIMVNPEAVAVQEIRVGAGRGSTGAKIVDSVAIRHANGSHQGHDSIELQLTFQRDV